VQALDPRQRLLMDPTGIASEVLDGCLVVVLLQLLLLLLKTMLLLLLEALLLLLLEVMLEASGLKKKILK
jgi:hypothetical protein